MHGFGFGKLPLIAARAAWLSCVVLVAGGCAARSSGPTPGARPFVESGFLTDYSKLQPAKPGALRHVYQNPAADLSRYDKLYFDRITLWRDADEKEDVESADFQRVADDLYAVISSQLGQTLALTNELGPGVLRVRMALVAVRDPDAPLDTYVTQAEANPANSEDPLPAGLRKFGREAWVEGELRDAQTGEVFFAVVDRAADVIPHPQPINTWGDLHRAFVAWSEQIAQRLAAMREHKS